MFAKTSSSEEGTSRPGHTGSSLRAGCVISIEFKKTFMDEWTGIANRGLVHAIGAAVQSTLPGLVEGLAHRE